MQWLVTATLYLAARPTHPRPTTKLHTLHTPLYFFTRSSTYTHTTFNSVLRCSKANTGGIALCGVFASPRSANLTMFHNKKLKHSLCVFGTTTTTTPY